jgi:hypothetical protein
MRLADSRAFKFYEFAPNQHDFYRCVKCNVIFTYEHERTRLWEMKRDSDVKMYICRCRSRRYAPTKPTLLEWLDPKVLLYTVKLVLARGVAPWAEHRANWLLPYIEWLVINKTTSEYR